MKTIFILPFYFKRIQCTGTYEDVCRALRLSSGYYEPEKAPDEDIFFEGMAEKDGKIWLSLRGSPYSSGRMEAVSMPVVQGKLKAIGDNLYIDACFRIPILGIVFFLLGYSPVLMAFFEIFSNSFDFLSWSHRFLKLFAIMFFVTLPFTLFFWFNSQDLEIRLITVCQC